MTFLDELQALREQVERNAKQEIPVQGSGGRIVVRFRPPPRDKLTKIIAAYRTFGAMDGDDELQFIVDCCDEILRRNDDTGELEPIDPDGGPLRFDAGDERWGDDVKTARDCVRKLYMLDTQPLALAGIADLLVDWLQGIDAEVAARVEGKSGNGATS